METREDGIQNGSEHGLIEHSRNRGERAIVRELRRHGLAAGLLVSLALSASAQTLLKADERRYADLCKAFSTKLEASIANTRIPGATAAIVLPDGRICTAAVGLTRTANGRRITPEDPILAASIGKTFVSALAMQLVEEGKLDLDKNISHWFSSKPWFARLPNARNITVRMLMNHTSGIPNHVEQKAFVSVETKDFDKDVGYEYLLTFILGKKPLFAAGKGYYYSDTNYFLLAMIEEQITGTTMYDEVTARFLQPLKLDHTTPANRNLDPAVYGYYENQPVVKKGKLMVNPQWEWAGGGFWSTPTDLARWAIALYSGKILKPETLDKMIKSTSTGDGASYGLGVEILNTKLGTSYGHDGDWPGYLSVMRYYPKYGVAVACQINAGGIPEAENFVETIAADLAVVFAEALAGVKLSADEKTAFETQATAWLHLIDSKKFADSWDTISTELKAKYSRDDWPNVLRPFQAKAGILRSRRFKSVFRADENVVIVDFSTSFSKAPAATEIVQLKREADGDTLATCGNGLRYSLLSRHFRPAYGSNP